MKRFPSIFILSILSSFQLVSAQTGINTQTPHPSTVLDISSTTKGLLAPRLTTAEKNAILNPAKGAVVYDKDLKNYTFYNGTSWVLPYTTITLPPRKYSIISLPITSSPTGGGSAETDANPNFGVVTVNQGMLASDSGNGLITLSGSQIVFNVAGKYLINLSGTFTELTDKNIKGRMILFKNGQDLVTDNKMEVYTHLPDSPTSNIKTSKKGAVLLDMVAGDYIIIKVKKDRFATSSSIATADKMVTWMEMILEIEKI